MSLLARQVGQIAWRSVVRTMRQPGAVIPPLTFPLLLMAVNSNGLEPATELRGFPTDSYLDFFIPFSFVQGALFAAATAGTDLARDIDSGFLNRLALTPMRGTALLLGQLGGAVALGILQAFVYLAVGLALGVDFVTGVGGVLVLLVLSIVISVAWAAVGLVLGLRTGSGEKVQAQLPLLFFLLFISSTNLPRELIEHDWFRNLATLNPVTYMIEGLRVLVITGWDGQALALGFGISIAVAATALAAAAAALPGRMART